MTEAVLLDLDGTLVRTGDAIVEAGLAAMAAAWPDLDAQQRGDAAQRYREDSAGHYARFSSGELTYEQMRHARFAQVADELCLPLTDEISSRHAAVFLQEFRRMYADPGRLYPDAVPMLDRLRAERVPVGLLTNSSGDLTDAKLGGLGLHERFDVIITRDTLGFGKPDARVFLHACEVLGVQPGATAYVGDEVHTDALAARDAGLAGIWLSRPGVADPSGARPSNLTGVRVVATLADV